MSHLRSSSRPLNRILPPYPILPFLLMIYLSLDLRLVQTVDYGVFAFGDVYCYHAEQGNINTIRTQDEGGRGDGGYVPRLTFLSLWKDTCPTAMSPVFCM